MHKKSLDCFKTPEELKKLLDHEYNLYVRRMQNINAHIIPETFKVYCTHKLKTDWELIE